MHNEINIFKIIIFNKYTNLVLSQKDWSSLSLYENQDVINH